MIDIFSKIKEIRNKSEATRIKILWMMVFVCMVFVIGIWFYVFMQRKNSAGNLLDLNLEKYPNYDSMARKLGDLEKEKNEAMKNVASELEKAEIESIAKKYIEENKPLKDGNFEDLKLERIEKWDGSWYLDYKQYYKNIPIERSNIGFIIDGDTKTVIVTSADFDFYNDIDIESEPDIEKEIAYEIIRKKTKNDNLELKNSQLVIYKDMKNGKYYLAWELVVFSDKPAYRYKYFIDAKNGDIIEYYSLMAEE